MPYRPGRQLISVEHARAILRVHGDPVTRVERVATRRRGPARARARSGGAARRAGVCAVDDGRVRGAGGGHDGRHTRAAGRAAPGGDASSPAARRRPPVTTGTCAGIATGAPMPEGADAVVIVEHTARSDETVSVFQAVAPRQHVGRAGSDLVAGEVAVAEGTVLSPARLGVVAALGLDAVDVFQRPRVAILSTGDEIVAPGGTLGPAQIFDSNTAALAAAMRLHGGEPVVARACRRRSRGADRRRSSVPRPGPGPVLRRHVGRRARLPARDHRGGRHRALRGPAAQAGQADRVCDGGGPARLRHAGQPRVVPHQRLPAGGAASAAHGAPAAGGRARRAGSARQPRSSSPAGRHQIYPVRVDGDHGGAGVQGIGRNHQPGARRRILRDTGGGRIGRSRDGGRGHVVLDTGLRTSDSGPWTLDPGRNKC